MFRLFFDKHGSAINPTPFNSKSATKYRKGKILLGIVELLDCFLSMLRCVKVYKANTTSTTSLAVLHDYDIRDFTPDLLERGAKRRLGGEMNKVGEGLGVEESVKVAVVDVLINNNNDVL